MNYRHAYHAGNHADVFKHLVLARIFALLGRKDTPYAYLDSHSGVGLYDLQGDEASRTGEWEQGIARLWEREGLPEQLDDYLDVIRHLNPDGSLRYYPGSPELARRLTRAQDRVLLNELHPEDGRLLKANMAGERRVRSRTSASSSVSTRPWNVASRRSCCVPSCTCIRSTTPSVSTAPGWPSSIRRGRWRTNCATCCPGWPRSWPRARATGVSTGWWRNSRQAGRHTPVPPRPQ